MESSLSEFGKAISPRANSSKKNKPSEDFSSSPPINKSEKDEMWDSTALSQWAICGPHTYKPVSVTYPILAGGVYEITVSQYHGVIFEKKTICVDDLLRFPDSVSEKILDEITTFWKKGDKFKERGFLHRRGYLLHGPPGSGKTCLVQQIIADIIKVGGLVFQCSNHPSIFNDGLSTYRKVEPNRPVVCLFEDIDAIIDENGDDDILALLDGENQIDKVLNIACPSPETLILRSDLTWIPAGELKVGDKLIAFDENPLSGWHVKKSLGRKFRTAVVKSCPVIIKPRFKVTTDTGKTIIVSENHPFLVKPGYHKPHIWKFVNNLKIGDNICSIGNPWKTGESHNDGYLAGQFDAEGSLNFHKPGNKRHSFRVHWTQSEGPLIKVMESLLQNQDFDVMIHKRSKKRSCGDGVVVPKSENYKTMYDLQINGGRWENIRLMGSVRPIRLLLNPRLKEAWEGVRVSCKYEKVVSVEEIGNGPVIALDTTTKTFIGNGLLQHNTTNYPEKLDPRLIARPRRFDRVLKIGMPNSDVRKLYFQKKLKVSDQELDKWVGATDGFSFASCAELVISVYCFEKPFEESVKILREMTSAKPNSREYDMEEGVGFGVGLKKK